MSSSNYNKWASRTWLLAAYCAVVLFLSLVWVEVKEVIFGLQTTWINIMVPFCSTVFGLYIGLEKRIDELSIKNNNGGG